MQSIITTSGYTMVPASGMEIIGKSLELVTLSTSGTISISGSLGSVNSLFYVSGSTTIPLEAQFLISESVTIVPSVGTLVFNYVICGEPNAYKYGKAVQWYSQTPPLEVYHQRWVGSTSGTYQPVSGGFGG